MNCLYSSVFVCLTIGVADPGPLVIVGGGATGAELHQKFLELAGGDEAVIAVLPQASQRAARGVSSAARFLECGAAESYVVELSDREAAISQISRATAVWFPGGSQRELYRALNDADVVNIIRKRHQAGMAAGGTSAGAAIMSRLMIPNSPKQQALTSGNTPIMEGLGLAPQFIVDQHFVERSRMNRLLSAVIDHPAHVGLGIGESTAVVLKQNLLTVIGTGSVIVIDARESSPSNEGEGTPQSCLGVELHVLKSGQVFDWKESRLINER